MSSLGRYVRDRKLAGWLLLLASFGIGLLTLYKGDFGDEADNLVVGALIVRGYALYGDVFSHHFPFPYYWVALVIGLLGKSIVIARLSLLAFQTGALALGMRLSGDHLMVGVFAILWSIMRSFYRGNMILYNAFAGTALVVIAIIVLAILQQRVTPNWKHWLTIGIFCTIAFLSDPLSVYAVAIALALLFTKRPAWGMSAGLVFIGSLSLYAGYLLVTGHAHAFWESAVLFNSQIYARYLNAGPLRLDELFSVVIRGLEIADPVWLDTNPFRPITGIYTDLDRWFFTGFLYRFSIIAAVLFLALRKQYRATIFLYLFAASTVIINKWGFRGQPFVMIALTAVSALITHEWWRDTSSRHMRTVQITTGAMVLVATGWLSLRLTTDIYNNLASYNDAQFATFEQESAYIRKLSCDQPDVLLAHYPFGSYYYWFTDMKPVSKYVFMWPWVAEVGLDAVIHELDQKQALAIVVRQEGVVWGLYDTKEFLRPLDEYLAANYQEVADGVYVSPALHAQCPS